MHLWTKRTNEGRLIMITKKNATLYDIARELGLSVTAVSRALNGKDGVSEETKAKVKEAAKRLNYTPNILAKSLRINSTKTIGVVVSDSSYSFSTGIIKGLEKTAADRGYNIILSNTDKDYEKEKKAIELLASKRIDGLIILSSLLAKSEDDINFIRGLGVPSIFVTRKPVCSDSDYVLNDNFKGAFLITDYLIKKGQRKIHYLNGPKDISSITARLEGYKSALEDNNIEYDPLIVYHIDETQEAGYSAMSKLLDKDGDIKAVMCGCDIIAIGVMQAILDKGYRIPEDIKVAGYDDIEFACYLRVPLTTVRQPQYTMGCEAMRILLDKVESVDESVRQVILDPELIIRQST